MYSFVKTFQRGHNSVFTTNTCKQPTLPFPWLKSRALLFFFVWLLYCFFYILPDDLIFPPWVLFSHTLGSASLPKEKDAREKTCSWNPYFIFYCISSLGHEIHSTLSCYPSLQLLFPALAWISSKLLFIFTSLHKPLGVSSLILALFQGLSSLLIFLLFLNTHIWLLHLVLPPPARLPTTQYFMVLFSPIDLLPLPIDSSDDISQYSGCSPSLSSFLGDLNHTWGFSFHVCVQGIGLQSGLLFSSLGSDCL